MKWAYSIYGYKRIRNRFRENVENSPQNIRGYTVYFTVHGTRRALLQDRVQSVNAVIKTDCDSCVSNVYNMYNVS